MPRTLIMSPDQVNRTVNRLVYEVIERNRGSSNLEIFGIRERGTALARSIATMLEKVEGISLQVNALDVAPYRDDVEPGSAPSDESEVSVDVTDRDLILVDDVLFTGRTARAALDAIVTLGRPRSIQLVVLIDRGHREYPIQPDYIGRMIPTKYGERIAVDEEDGFSVYVED